MSGLTLQDIDLMPPKIKAQILAQIHPPAPRPALPTPCPPPAPTRGRKRQQPESLSQQAVVAWWAAECVLHGLPEKTLKAFPLAGARTKKNGSRLKCEGMRAGTLDMFLGVPRGSWHGLWIEMKAPKGTISPAQKEMLKLELAQGYCTVVCRSTDEAKAAILSYLATNSTATT